MVGATGSQHVLAASMANRSTAADATVVWRRWGLVRFETEYAVLAEVPPHPNIMRFYTQFVAPVPPSMMPDLPPAVREFMTTDATGRQRTQPLPTQWAVFSWHARTLAEYLRAWRERHGHALDPREAGRLVIQLLDALIHLEDHHVVHRDLKLDNLMVDEDGTLVLVDFGLATRTGEGGRCMLAPGSAVTGNTEHTAPEVLAAARELSRSATADPVAVPYGRQAVFGAGVVIGQIITGAHPMPGYPASGSSGCVTYGCACGWGAPRSGRRRGLTAASTCVRDGRCC